MRRWLRGRKDARIVRGSTVNARTPVASTTAQHILGEGVRWDTRRDELLRVDIVAGHVHRDRVADDGSLIPVRTYALTGTVGAITPIEGDEGWLLAAGRGFSHLSPDGSVRPVSEVAAAGTRMNDAACDAHGRFWAGTMALDQHRGGGALYRLDRDGRTNMVLGNLTIPNGIGWSPDGRTMYLVDSGPRVVHRFTYEPRRGAVSDRQPLITVPEDVGAPDGLTVDAQGDLWVAIYGGGRVNHYSADGRLLDTLFAPAAQTTSCAFAGPALDVLFVTTATENWTDEQRRAEPAAGLVYRFHTDVTGRPAEPFRPERGWWTDLAR